MDTADGMLGMMVGLSLGLLRGVAAALPDRFDVVVEMDRDERAVLANGRPTRDLERRICARVKDAFEKTFGSREDLDVLCPDVQ